MKIINDSTILIIIGFLIFYCYCQDTKKPACDLSKNEIYDSCASCPRICQNGTFQQIYCIWCTGGCGCQQGYVRLENGNCIKEETCCKKPYQHFQANGPFCPDVCRNGTMVSSPCGDGNRDCYCDSGYVFNENRDCIQRNQCKPK